MSEMPDMSEQRLEVWESGSGTQRTTEVCCCLVADDLGSSTCEAFRGALVQRHPNSKTNARYVQDKRLRLLLRAKSMS
jgi:hypothetical protein